MTNNYKLLFIFTTVFSVLISLDTFALSYTLSFTGSGASTIIDSVVVQNLTKATQVTIAKGGVLNLTDLTTNVVSINKCNNSIQVTGNNAGTQILQFTTEFPGEYIISAYNIRGEKVVIISQTLLYGLNSFELSFPRGIFIVSIDGQGKSYSTQFINLYSQQSSPAINYTGNSASITNSIQKAKSTANSTTMLYSSGDQLIYKGFSGNYKTLVPDTPSANKTINLEFVECKDADGNNYAVVKIGTQTWMAENLRTTKYNDGSSLTPISEYEYMYWIDPLSPFSASYAGAYSSKHYNDIAYRNTHGCFYNLFAAINSKLAPVGWHVASDAEWSILSDHLGGMSVAGGKLKSISGWNTPNIGASNSTGFSASAGGVCSNGIFNGTRYSESWWTSTYVEHKVSPSLSIFSGKRRGLTWEYKELNYGLGDSDQCAGNKVRCIKD